VSLEEEHTEDAPEALRRGDIDAALLTSSLDSDEAVITTDLTERRDALRHRRQPHLGARAAPQPERHPPTPPLHSASHPDRITLVHACGVWPTTPTPGGQLSAPGKRPAWTASPSV